MQGRGYLQIGILTDTGNLMFLSCPMCEECVNGLGGKLSKFLP